MFIRLHHVGLLVNDLNETKKLYCDQFGLKPGRCFDLVRENVRILNIPIGDSMIEVNQVINHDSGVGRYLAKWGDGLHHLCLETDDMEADLKMLEGLGFKLIKPLSVSDYGVKVGWIHPKQAQGVLLELWQNPPDKPDISHT
ncbi:MAG: VOC family protein [Dehalococcoidia bacterium]